MISALTAVASGRPDSWVQYSPTLRPHKGLGTGGLEQLHGVEPDAQGSAARRMRTTSTRRWTLGKVRKSVETNGSMWLVTSERAGARFGMRRQTLALADIDAELQEFPVDVRRNAQGYAANIILASVAVSAFMRRRPRVGRAECRVQYWRKRGRCHRRTVSGGHDNEAEFERRKAHSARVSTTICWRWAGFSRARSR